MATSTSWKTEEENANSQAILQRDVAISLTAHQLESTGTQKAKQTFKVKAFLVLCDSDKEDWGIVEDTLSDIGWEPGKGEVVGTWSRAKYNNLIHLSLCDSISALQDRSIQTFAQYAEERRQRATGAKKAPKKTKVAAEPTHEQVPTPDISFDEKMKFNGLRARLGRAK